MPTFILDSTGFMSSTSIIVDQIRSGEAARNIKLYAAQGIVPISQDQLISLQVLLSRDPDQEISVAAKSALSSLPERTWIQLLERKDPDRDVVDYCLEQPEFPLSVREKILLNHSIPDGIIRRMARTEAGSLLDMILSNQVRLLRDPEILDELESNPFLTIDQKRRLEEFKDEFVFKRGMEAHREREPGERAPILDLSLDDILAQIPTLDAEAQKMIQEADAAPPPKEISDQQVNQVLKDLFSTDELDEIPEEVLTLYQRLLKMSQGDKIRTALFGSKEERAILIRDTSKVVAMMVLKNPKLTETEVENFALMKNLDSELLRQMGRSREFLKKYGVVHNLTKNPKTPSPIALNLLKLLRESDLKSLSNDRNVPEVVRRQAKRLFEMKGKRR